MWNLYPLLVCIRYKWTTTIEIFIMLGILNDILTENSVLQNCMFVWLLKKNIYQYDKTAYMYVCMIVSKKKKKW